MVNLHAGAYATINDLDMYYETVGNGTSSILLIHPVSIDGRIWRELSSLISSKYRLVIPDLPGHGKSDILPKWSWNSKNVSLDDYAVLLNMLLDHLNIKKSIALVGCGMGGNIALDLGLRLKDRVDCIVCYGEAGKTRTFDERTKSSNCDLNKDILTNLRSKDVDA